MRTTAQVAGIVISNKQSAQVLILDDEADLADELVDWLYGKNLIAVSASDPEKFVEIYKSNDQCRVLIVDLRLPFTFGYEVIRTVLEFPKSSQSPAIIYMSGSPSQDDFDKMSEISEYDFVAKPPNLDVLYQLILDKI